MKYVVGNYIKCGININGDYYEGYVRKQYKKSRYKKQVERQITHFDKEWEKKVSRIDYK